MNPFAALIDLSQFSALDGFIVEGINPNFGNGVGSGGAVSPIGDINGDGIGDFAVGAERGVSIDPVTGLQRFTSGDVYVVFGRATGFPLNFDPASLNGTDGFILRGGREAQGLGFSVSGAGDVNGDGIDDLLIGTRATSLGQSAEPGEAFVVFGRTTGFQPVQDVYTLTNAEGFRIVDPNPSIPGQLGRSATNIGDFNNDGIDDFAIGEAKSGSPFLPSGIEHGAVHVILGDTGIGLVGGTLGTTGRTPAQFGASTTVITYHGPLDEAGLGTSVSGIGDFNGDGIDDLIAMAPGAPFRSPAERFATVIFGDANVPPAGNFNVNLAANIPPNTPLPWFFIRNTADLAGVAANAGDMNGDGLDDLIIGGPNANGGTGLAYVIYGTANPVLNFDLSTLDGSNGFTILGDQAAGFFGNSVHSAGDVNNDGYDDVIVGAFGANRTPIPGQTQDWLGGAAYVIYGAPGTRAATFDVSTLNGTNGFAVEGISPFSVNPDDGVGAAVSGGEDINGDGIDDILIGAEDATSSPGTVQEVAAGRTYVIYGKDTGDRALLTGTPNRDFIDGAGGNDQILGLGGSDFLTGQDGDDLLEGGDDVDLLRGGEGQDILDGGDSVDFASFADAPGPLTFDFQNWANSSPFITEDTLIDIELFEGAANFSNTVIGSAGNEFFIGGAAVDTITLGAGNDVAQGLGGDDIIDAGPGSDAVFGNTGDDIIRAGTNDGIIDVIWFTDGDGADMLYEFEVGTDLIGFLGNTFNQFSDLTVTQNAAGNAVVTYGTDTIEVVGVSGTAMDDAANFFFI